MTITPIWVWLVVGIIIPNILKKKLFQTTNQGYMIDYDCMIQF